MRATACSICPVVLVLLCNILCKAAVGLNPTSDEAFIGWKGESYQPPMQVSAQMDQLCKDRHIFVCLSFAFVVKAYH